MNLTIKFDKSLPVEHQAMAERSLRTAIDFLDSKPRPMTQLNPVVTTTASTPAPAPTPSPYETEIIAEQEAMWNFIRSKSDSCDSACGSTEDHDK